MKLQMSGGVFVQNMSLPSRECGLKYKLYIYDDVSEYVTPLAGVWIEICYKLLQNVRPDVTPLAGVWIEICTSAILHRLFIVTPLAGVWIEIMKYTDRCRKNTVTPLAGVWIEMSSVPKMSIPASSHSPRGSVD